MSQATVPTFLFFWLTFTGLVLVAMLVLLIWAARSGQFSNQDYARYLPLMSGIPEEADLREQGGESSEDSSSVTKDGD